PPMSRLEAFQQLGGTARQRKPCRYEVTHVPAPIRHCDHLIGIGEPTLPCYERIAFGKTLIAPPGQPLAAFACPGHPLLDAAADLTLKRHCDLLADPVAINKPEDFILAIVEFMADSSHRIRYVRRPFRREPDFTELSRDARYRSRLCTAISTCSR